MHIGCHVSVEDGIINAPKRAADISCEVMQIFTRPPQGGKAPELTQEIIKNFKILTTKYQIQNTYIHTPYYINLASSDNRIRYGSASTIRSELERGTLLGAKYVMSHMGSARDSRTHREAIQKVVEMLGKSLDGYKGTTKLLLENSAGAGAIIGDHLKELAEIIDEIKSPYVPGICLDTQHSFASGYDWRDFANTIEKVDRELGLQKIKLIHANDSQSELGSKKDRHEHIGKGKIGLESFRNIVAFAQKNNIDMICETEYPEVKEDIKTLKFLRT